jgi:serine protease Do
VRPQLLHLSGPNRGRTITYAKSRLLFGTGDEADIRYPSSPSVADRHAELTFVEEGCAFYLKALEGQVFVNRQEIREVILEHGDLVEIGVGGPKLRFRVDTSDGKPCKAVRLMLRDAREVHGESGLVASSHSLRRDLLTQASWQARVMFVVVLVAVVVGAAYFGGLVGTAQTAKKHEVLRKQETQLYEREFAKLRAQMEEFGREQTGHVSREEVDKLRADLASRAQVVDELVQRNDALSEVLEVYSRGVCLIYGSYTFKVRQDDTLVSVVGPHGNPLELEYMGSGFLASAEGHVITNRHVAEPWWNNEVVASLIDQGMLPEFVHLSATFPGKLPATVDPDSIRLSSDNVDLAVLQVAISDVPVPPLFSGDLRTLRGGRVIVLGYPTGLNAILARAEQDLVAEVLANAVDTTSLIAELAKRGLISPVITQGALNEVREKRLVYDAETTSGGSGGPVFGSDGTVIGVNFAITRDFDGSNFGVPIDFARKLIP